MATPRAQADILVVAALNRELTPLKKAALRSVTLLETGEGVANAGRSLDSRLSRETSRAVLSIGFAGALSPALEVGDLVIADKIHDSQGQPDAALLKAAAAMKAEWPVHFGLAVTSDTILWQAVEKSQLADSLGTDEMCFVDLESTAIARVCARHAVPFLIVRSMTDLFDEDLPLDFNLCRGADGRVISAKVMRAALANPRALSGLFELQKRSKLCADRLGEFVRLLVSLIP
jgi:adenosylhomocysteine nucleosidase